MVITCFALFNTSSMISKYNRFFCYATKYLGMTKYVIYSI